jgi:polyferredoxin
MDHDPDAPRRRRETLLTFLLATVFAGGILFFLVLVSGGFFVFVMAVVFAITLVGLLHYALWGYALTQEVAGEREEAEERARWETDEEQGPFWDRPPRY